MNTLKKIWSWLVWSSKDPQKISLTLKAGIPYLVIMMAWTGITPPDNNAIIYLIDSIVNAIVLLVQSVLAIVALYGSYRKVKTSMTK